MEILKDKIKILKFEDIKNILKYIKIKYGKTYLKSFKKYKVKK